MDDQSKCWLCGRTVDEGETRSPFPQAGIPIHRECLEGERCSNADAPLGKPGDVVYLF